MLREWVHTVGVAAGLDPARVSLLTGAIGSPESSVEMEIAGFGNMAGEFLFIFVWAIRVTSRVLFTEIDAFFNAIPGAEHRKWGERFAAHVVDGSPIWRIVRVVPVHAPPSTVSQSRASTSASVPAKDGAELVFADVDEDSIAAEDPMAAAIRKALEGGFEMPAKVAPRAPRRPSGIQFDGVDVFEADAFGDASAPGGLVFPSSNDDENEDENGDGEDAASSSAGGSDETDDGGIDLSQYPPGSKVVTDWKGEPMVITPGDKLPFVS